jgi:hypothetical protein
MPITIKNSAGGGVTLDSTTSNNETVNLPTGGGTLVGTATPSFTGNATITSGNLVIATAGKGLAVGGTGAANTLDDYEEGTWSMVIKGSTGSTGSWAQAGVQASYTKIGRVVHFSGTGYVSNKGSYSGQLQVQGLPFASGNTNGNTAVSASAIPVAAFGNAVYIPQVLANSSACQIRKGTYLDATAQWSELVVNIRLNISGFYTTA